ncbi:MAG: hypothetical protein GX577_15525 [Leptolinea sp.]|nr:hypothetical protein [Leptolinea sp.]
MPEYRNAKCIELHDSNIALTTSKESYLSTGPSGRTEWATKQAYTVYLSDLRKMAEVLGLDTCSTDDESVELPIYKVHHDYCDSISGSDETITKLECEVLSERLVNIRVTSVFKDNAEPYIEEITYSGSFTVWWVTDEA